MPSIVPPRAQTERDPQFIRVSKLSTALCRNFGGRNASDYGALFKSLTAKPPPGKPKVPKVGAEMRPVPVSAP